MADRQLRALERRAKAEERTLHDDPAILRVWLRQGRRSGERSCLRCEGGGVVKVGWISGSPKAAPPKEGDARNNCPDCDGTGRAPLTWGINLAAYVGHEASREVEGGWDDDCGCDGSEWDHPNSAHVDSLGLTEWSHNLLRAYGHRVMLRAAVAAAWVVLWRVASDVCEDPRRTPSRAPPSCCSAHVLAARSIKAAATYAYCPTDVIRLEWLYAWNAQSIRSPRWLPLPPFSGGFAADIRAERWLREVPVAAAGEAGEPAVRQAIRDEVSLWALGGE